MAIMAGFMVPHPPLIVSEVGRGSEKDVSLTINSYLEVAREIASIKPDTIIISSPHTALYYDYFHLSKTDTVKGSFSKFGASEVSFMEDVDLELVDEIDRIAKDMDFPTGKESNYSELDHGSMVPLYFIKKFYTDFKVIIVGLSELAFSEHYKIGQIINEAVSNLNRKVVYVASGDLSHKLQDNGPYGFVEEGPIYDKKVMDIMSNGRFLELLEFDGDLRKKASECGHRSFIMMAGAFDKKELDIKMLSHEDITGVGYGICTYYPIGDNIERNYLDKYLANIKEKIDNNLEDEYITLARKSIESYILFGKELEITNSIPDNLLNKKRGVFVSIHREGILRGCIGTIYPVYDSIALEIIKNAISAATRDRRFMSIKKWEVPYLEIHVDEMLEAEDISSTSELDVKEYGVIVSSGFKRGLLLPDLDGIDTVEKQLEIALSKGGISKNEEYTLQRFKVIRHT